MSSTTTPVGLSPEEAEALAVVRDWRRAFAARDLDALLALAATDIRLGAGDRAVYGHEGVRRMLHLQSYGVAHHPRPLRYHACGSTVAVEAVVELRWVDGDGLAGSEEGVAVFELAGGRVRRFCPYPDTAAAFCAAGWPPPGTTTVRDPDLTA